MNGAGMEFPGADGPIVEIDGVTNSFGTSVVHENLSLTVRQGEILGLIGGSGTGKSVLLQTVLGPRRPQAGAIRVMGVDIEHAAAAALRNVRRQWGVLFQDGALFSSLSVMENVKVPLREFTDMDDELMNNIALMKISMVGLPDNSADKFPSELSGGMRKRAGLARALALDPAIVFLDEPTAGLDPVGAAAFDELVLDLHNSLGLTVFMVTHDLDTLHAICTRVAVLAEKKILASGTIDELLAVKHPWIQEYFSGPRGRAAAASYPSPVGKRRNGRPEKEAPNEPLHGK